MSCIQNNVPSTYSIQNDEPSTYSEFRTVFQDKYKINEMNFHHLYGYNENGIFEKTTPAIFIKNANELILVKSLLYNNIQVFRLEGGGYLAYPGLPVKRGKTVSTLAGRQDT